MLLDDALSTLSEDELWVVSSVLPGHAIVIPKVNAQPVVPFMEIWEGPCPKMGPVVLIASQVTWDKKPWYSYGTKWMKILRFLSLIIWRNL